jgi:hypothetical protein
MNQINQNLDNLLIKLNCLNKSYYQVILVVIANDTNDYYCEMMKNYWIPFINYIKQHKLSIKVFLLFGQQLKNIQIDSDDIIITNTGEGYIPQILKKTIFAFEYIYNNFDFKHLIRTNLSSFLRSDKILELSNNLESYDVYTGVSGKGFVSGAAFWLSKNTILHLLENKQKLNFNLTDDCAIYKILYSKFYKKSITVRQDFTDYVILKNSNKHILHKYNSYHIRIKSNNRHNDAMIMKFFFEYYYL